jgi:hypothetical protein
MGYGSFPSRKIWHASEKMCCISSGVFLRTKLIEKDLGVLQIGGVEAICEPLVNTGEQDVGLLRDLVSLPRCTVDGVGERSIDSI